MTLAMSGLPANYMNQQYWQYLSQLIAQQQQIQQAQQQSIYDAMQLQQAQNQQQQSFQEMDASQLAAMQQQMAAQQLQPGENGTGLTMPKGDGKDDGVISFGSKLKNMGKGVINFFKGMVCDETGKFSIKRTLTTVAVAAGAVALTVATGGAATPFLIAGSAALGGAQVIKGGINAYNAKTDAEAENAWQDIGSGTTAVVGALAGAKGALRVSGAVIPKGNMLTSSLRATGQCFKTSGKASWAGMKALRHPKTAYGSVKGYYKNTVKPNMVEAFSPNKAQANLKTSLIDNEVAKLQKLNNKAIKIREELAKPDIKPEKAIKLNEQLAKIQEEGLIRAIKIEKAQQVENFTAKNLKDIKQHRSSQRKTLEDGVNNATTKKDKLIAQKALKEFDKLSKFGQKVEQADYFTSNMNRAKNALKNVENELKGSGLTDARKLALEGQKTKLQKIVFANQKLLFKINANVAAQKYLPQVGLAYGTHYLAGRTNPIEGNQEMSQDELLQLMQQQQMMAQQMAIDPANPYAQNPAAPNPYAQNTAMTNPYGQYNTNMFATQPPVGNSLGFQDLYVSPYPPTI